MSVTGVIMIMSCYLLCAIVFLVWWAGFWLAGGRERVAMVMYALMPFALFVPALIAALEAGQEGGTSVDWPSAIGEGIACYVVVPLIVLAICRAWPFGPKPWAEYRKAVDGFREESEGVDPSLSYRESRRKVVTLSVFGLFASLSLGLIGCLMAFSETGRDLQAQSSTAGYFEFGMAFLFFAAVILVFSVRELIRWRKAGPLDPDAPDRPPGESGAAQGASFLAGLALAVKHFIVDD